MYEAYLEKYPNGEFVPLAQVRLEELRAPDRVTHQGRSRRAGSRAESESTLRSISHPD
jgi:hypothetical protein